MLTSMNHVVITCLECKEVIQIEPGRTFEPLVHECKKLAIEVKEEPQISKQMRKRNNNGTL